MNTQIADLIKTVGLPLLQSVISGLQLAHSAPTGATQSAADAANQTKAAAAIAATTTLATTLAPDITKTIDASTLPGICATIVETLYQQMKASGMLAGPSVPSPTSATTAAPAKAATPLTTPVIITGATLTGNWQAPK